MGYGMISETGNVLVKLLSDNLVPDVVTTPDGIGMCSPDDHGDLNLGIYLYDVAESEEILAPGMVNSGLRRQAYPSTFLDLYYMLTAYSNSDLKFRAGEEQRILGRVVQVLRDNSVLPEHALGEGANLAARIELQQMERYEKMRLWNFPNIPYRLSLFYRVGPIEIASAKTRDIVRVTDVDFMVREQLDR
ncbi:MAG: DUF4255 domain-containing protein [Lachnospiraceae bacterium]|nr:DUF4255 domain-containing protein [Lachnospiraceae bacterium]